MEFNTLITSGAYVGEEIQAEFGRLPPAFLPIGVAYVLQHQLSQLEGRNNLWLSIPEDFELSESQQRLIDDHEIRLLRVDSNKSLGLSVFQCILEIGPERPLQIIHGDTIVKKPAPPANDAVSVSGVSEQYRWGVVKIANRELRGVHDADRGDDLGAESWILSGLFSIREPWRFLKCLVGRDFSFTGALDSYCREARVFAEKRIETLDCGHLKTYYKSRRDLAAARYFNAVGVEGAVFRKRSADKRKIDAEAYWLRSIPADLQPYTARLIDEGDAAVTGEYRTLYSSYPTLAELYLARSSKLVWRRILDSCSEYLEKAAGHTAPSEKSAFEWLVVGKLKERLAQYPAFLPNPDQLLTFNGQAIGTLNEIIETISEVVQAAPHRPACVMHGDFCFSNILFDLRSDRIQLIDPRGLIGDTVTIYGDIRYDIAKLGHSILGRYDQILGEGLRAKVTGTTFALRIPQDSSREWLEREFLKLRINEQESDSQEIKAAIVSLFLSMVPLHSEDKERQTALFSNGLRLYAKFYASLLERKYL